MKEEKLLSMSSKLVKEINSLIVQGFGSFDIRVNRPLERIGADIIISAAYPYTQERKTIAVNFEKTVDAVEIMAMIKEHEFKIFCQTF